MVSEIQSQQKWSQNESHNRNVLVTNRAVDACAQLIEQTLRGDTAKQYNIMLVLFMLLVAVCTVHVGCMHSVQSRAQVHTVACEQTNTALSPSLGCF